MYRQVLDLYATSVDYDPRSPESIAFFKMVQNKLHYATHGNTAELIYTRADGLLSDTEEEDEGLNAQYEALSASEQVQMKEKNWERAFDLTPMDNEWMRRGDTIQATFWELKKEHIKKVRFFTAASNIPSRPNDERVRKNQ